MRRLAAGALFLGICAIPLVHLFTGAAIPFGNDGHCDPWYYFGLMEFPSLGHILAPSARVISRVPAYLPIRILKGIGLPITEQDLYFWLNHLVFATSTIIGLAAIFDAGTALLVTTLLTTSSLYLSILSTTYPTGAALAYASAAFACVAIGSRLSNWIRLFSCVAGVLIALSLQSHLVGAVFIFFFPVLYLTMSMRTFLLSALSMLLGILIGTAAVGLADLRLGLSFWSIAYQIRDMIDGIGMYWYPGWMERSIGLLLMIFLPLLQLITWYRKQKGKRSATILTSVMAVSVINLLLTFADRNQNLIFSYLYVMTIPIAALVFADAIEQYTAQIRVRWLIVILACLLLCHVIVVTYFRTYLAMGFMPLALTGAIAMLVVAINHERGRLQNVGIASIAALFILCQGTLGADFLDHLNASRATAERNTKTVEKALDFMLTGLPKSLSCGWAKCLMELLNWEHFVRLFGAASPSTFQIGYQIADCNGNHP